MSIYSTSEELILIQNILSKYIRLPFSGDTIPGAIMETVLANVRSATVLKTYDFVDVVSQATKCGWQVKSTKENTPVTWKRAKIPNATGLIEESKRNEKGLQQLGNAIIEFCNQHAKESLKQYNLEKIGYARLVVHNGGKVTYFERELCSHENPIIFDPASFSWQWSKPKRAVKKEQLPAFHGTNRQTNKKWWAWHGLGENQLHFNGEREWWPNGSTKDQETHMVSFELPSVGDKISFGVFVDLLSELDASS